MCNLRCCCAIPCTTASFCTAANPSASFGFSTKFGTGFDTVDLTCAGAVKVDGVCCPAADPPGRLWDEPRLCRSRLCRKSIPPSRYHFSYREASTSAAFLRCSSPLSQSWAAAEPRYRTSANSAWMFRTCPGQYNLTGLSWDKNLDNSSAAGATTLRLSVM